jgi:hypothetical protein
MRSLFYFCTRVFFVCLLGIHVASPVRGEVAPQSDIKMEWSGRTVGKNSAPIIWQALSVVVAGSTLRVHGRVSGSRSTEGKVFCEDRSFQVSPNGEFLVEVLYSDNPEKLDLAWIGKTGQVSKFFLSYRSKPAVIEATGPLEANDSEKRSRFLLGTGATSIWYNQNIFRLSDYQATVWTLKGSYHYALVPKKWDLGVSGYVNLFTVAENLDAQIRFFGSNVRLGYVYGPIWKDWLFTFYGGWNYASMSARSQSFGFRNAMGPQILPMFRKTLSDGSSAAFYGKFSPISSGLRILGLANHEHAVGFNYSFQRWGQRLNLSVDYARLMLAFSERFIDSRSLSFGIGLIF